MIKFNYCPVLGLKDYEIKKPVREVGNVNPTKKYRGKLINKNQ